MKIFIIYLLFLNFMGFLSMGMDKKRAQNHAWRIPEKTLFFFCLAGGSIGSILGMHLFHHKTKHWYFLFGMPLILICQVILAGYLKGLF